MLLGGCEYREAMGALLDVAAPKLIDAVASQQHEFDLFVPSFDLCCGNSDADTSEAGKKTRLNAW